MFVLSLLLQYEVLQDDYQSAISRVDDLGIQLNNEVQRNAVLSVSIPNLYQKLISISRSWFIAKLYRYLWYGSEGSPVILDMISRFAEFWINGVILLLNQECLRFNFCLFIYFGSYILNSSESMAIYWQRHLLLYINYLLVAYCDAGETEEPWEWYCLLEEWSK